MTNRLRPMLRYLKSLPEGVRITLTLLAVAITIESCDQVRMAAIKRDIVENDYYVLEKIQEAILTKKFSDEGYANISHHKVSYNRYITYLSYSIKRNPDNYEVWIFGHYPARPFWIFSGEVKEERHLWYVKRDAYAKYRVRVTPHNATMEQE